MYYLLFDSYYHIYTIDTSSTYSIVDIVVLQKECPDYIQQLIIESKAMIITVQTQFMKNILSIYCKDLINPTINNDDNTTFDSVSIASSSKLNGDYNLNL